LHHPEDLARLPLLRSYRQSDWPAWLAAAGATRVVARGPVFDASALMVQAALRGEGVALAPPCMFARELRAGRLVQPFAQTLDAGGYWLTRLVSREPTAAMHAFAAWLRSECGASTAAEHAAR
jgi:LysR family transcriptional regulator of beta-lactamase